MLYVSDVPAFNAKQKKRFIVAAMILISLFFVVKFGGPLLVKPFYEAGRIDLLNILTGSEGIRSLGYYSGRIEETLFGPFGSVISGVVLLLACGGFLKELNLRAYVGVMFLYLLITKFEILFFPTYGDTIGGVFAESIWLLQNNFDYMALARQPSFVQGGPRVYLFSIYPAYLAGLMRLIPHVKTFLLVNHLLVFLYASIIVSFFRSTLFRLTDRYTATLLSVLLLSMPLFQSQSEAISMEIPTLMFSMVSIYYLVKKDIRKASLYAIGASLIKAYAVYVCITVFFVGILMFFLDEKKAWRKQTLLWSFAAGSFFVLKFIASTFVFQIDGKVNFIGFLEGWPIMKTMILSYIYLFSVCVFSVAVFQRARQERRKSLKDIFSHYYVQIIFFVCTGAWFGLFLNSYAILNRYRLHMIPFLLGCVFIVCKVMIRSDRVLQRLVGAGIIIGCLCAYGMNYVTDGAFASGFERSLEYRNDLKLHMEIAKRLEEQYASFTIAAPFTIAQILALPELGYVKKPLDVIIYGYPCTYAGIRNFRGLQHMQLSQTIWVGLDEPTRWTLPYPVGPEDRIIEEIYIGNRRGVLFLGGFAIERLRQIFLQLSRMGELRSSYDGRAVTIHEEPE